MAVGAGVSVATGVGVTLTATDSSGLLPPKLQAAINTDADMAIAEIARILLFLITSSLISVMIIVYNKTFVLYFTILLHACQ